MRIVIAAFVCMWVVAATGQNNEATNKPARPDIVIADFEGADYGAWKTTGTAFGDGPVRERLPGQQLVRGYVGHGFASSFHGGDESAGTLTSPEFKIERRFINFCIGGGKAGFPLTKTFMDLIVDGKVMLTVPAFSNRELLERESWDVSELMGKTGRIQIVDAANRGWGHINVDQIVQSDMEDGKAITELPQASAQPYESDPLAMRNVPANTTIATGTKGIPAQPLPTGNKTATAGGMGDLREFIVNGKTVTVDVAPVNSWLLVATTTTPGRNSTKARNYNDPKRPMKWWKVCAIQEILGSDSLIDHCVVSIDGNLPVRAYIKHLDPNIRDPFLPILELENQAAEVQGLIDADQAVLDSFVNAIGVPPNPPRTPRGLEWKARQNFQAWQEALNRINANNTKLYGWQMFDVAGRGSNEEISPHRAGKEPVANSIKGRINAQLDRIKSAQSVEFLAAAVDTADDIGGRKKNQVLDCGLRK